MKIGKCSLHDEKHGRLSFLLLSKNAPRDSWTCLSFSVQISRVSSKNQTWVGPMRVCTRFLQVVLMLLFFFFTRALYYYYRRHWRQTVSFGFKKADRRDRPSQEARSGVHGRGRWGPGRVIPCWRGTCLDSGCRHMDIHRPIILTVYIYIYIYIFYVFGGSFWASCFLNVFPFLL